MLHDYIFRHHPGCVAVRGAEASLGAEVRWFFLRFHSFFKNNYLFMGCTGASLEKAMAAHSSTLAWKILWAEEPGGLQSMGSLRVGHD